MSGEASNGNSGEIRIEVEGDDDAQAEASERADTDSDASDAESELEAAQKAKQETYERLLRTTADFDNFRKRSRRDLQDARIEARTRVLKEILPVVDNLERAVQHAESATDASGIVDGVKLVLRQFAQALTRCEVVAVDAGGKPFDPTLHEAISQMETSEHPAGTVCEVVQKGYLIGDRLLRPALVVVAKGAATSSEATAAAPEESGTDDDGSVEEQASGEIKGSD